MTVTSGATSAAASAASVEAPALTTAERDRRYAVVRENLRERGVEAVIVQGRNLTYLTNGVPGEHYALLPAADDRGVTAFINRRHIADIPVEVIYDAQDWVSDIRPASNYVHDPRQVSDTSELIGLIRELGLAEGVVGYDAGINHQVHEQLAAAYPRLTLVDASDALNSARTIKSPAELALIEAAHRVWDHAVEVVRRDARPGMLGREVRQLAIRAMWEAGGDVDSDVYFSFGAHPNQNPALAEFGMGRALKAGDMLTLTSMAKYRHYFGHTDQQISLGEPSRLHRDMFDAIREVRDAVVTEIVPGGSHSHLVETYRKAVAETPFHWSTHSQIHQYGSDVPEYPGGKYRIGEREMSQAEEQRDSTLNPGMVYTISPTLLSPDRQDTLLGGKSLVVTDDGYRDLERRPVELLVADA